MQINARLCAISIKDKTTHFRVWLMFVYWENDGTLLNTSNFLPSEHSKNIRLASDRKKVVFIIFSRQNTLRQSNNTPYWPFKEICWFKFQGGTIERTVLSDSADQCFREDVGYFRRIEFDLVQCMLNIDVWTTLEKKNGESLHLFLLSITYLIFIRMTK